MKAISLTIQKLVNLSAEKTNRQIYRLTKGQAKKFMPQIYQCGSIKTCIMD